MLPPTLENVPRCRGVGCIAYLHLLITILLCSIIIAILTKSEIKEYAPESPRRQIPCHCQNNAASAWDSGIFFGGKAVPVRVIATQSMSAQLRVGTPRGLSPQHRHRDHHHQGIEGEEAPSASVGSVGRIKAERHPSHTTFRYRDSVSRRC